MTIVTQISDIPPFSEPYQPRTVRITTTDDTQIMQVPYNLGDKTARFFPTRIRVNNVDATDAVTVVIWDSDLDADAAIITAGANGSNTVPLLQTTDLAAKTERVWEFSPILSGWWVHLGICAKLSAGVDVDITVEGYMQY